MANTVSRLMSLMEDDDRQRAPGIGVEGGSGSKEGGGSVSIGYEPWDYETPRGYNRFPRHALGENPWWRVEEDARYNGDIQGRWQIGEYDDFDPYIPEEADPDDEPWAHVRLPLGPLSHQAIEFHDPEYGVEAWVALMFVTKIDQHTFEQYL